MKDQIITLGEMIEALTQYYEAAGFTDIYERELKNKTKKEIEILYKKINEDNDGYGL